MYWQVYLHKTALAAEKMLVKIIERVKACYQEGLGDLATFSSLDYFLIDFNGDMNTTALQQFVRLDDVDVMSAVKKWATHKDPILSLLCSRLLNRKLYKS
ncbi:hypothetical protein ABTF70_18585, partial [Acinetobacter baumannii]